MSLRLFALPCGWLEASLGAFLAGARGTIRVPVPSWLVLHPRGALVFGTGLHVETQRDSAARLGPIARVFRVHFAAGDELDARLRTLDGEHDVFGDDSVRCLPTHGHPNATLEIR